MKQTLINCPCGYGNNLGPENVTCPVCGLNLEPLHRIHAFPTEYFEKGKSSYEQNDFEKAKQYFLTSLSLTGTSDPVMNEYLGRCYLATGDYKNADKYIKLAAGQNTDNQDIRNLLWELRKKKNSGTIRRMIIPGLLIILPIFCLIFILSANRAKHEISRLEDTISVQNESLASLKSITIQPEEKGSIANESYSLLYHVRPGETLSLISYSVYGTDEKWEIIFNANKDKIQNPDILEEHSTILIPLKTKDLK